MKKKRVFKTLAYTLLMIGTISMSSWTQSGAKYHRESIDSEVLHYSATFKQMKGEIKSQRIEPGSKSHTLKYAFTFDRNSLINGKDKENDKYEISVSNGCEIESVISGYGTVENPGVLSNKKVLSYDNRYDDEITVKMSCRVSDITKNGYLKFSMDVYEIFNNVSGDDTKEVKYLYVTGDDRNGISASSYAQKYPVIDLVEGKRAVIDPAGKTSERIYEEFKHWVNSYTNEAIGEEAIQYIEKFFTTDHYINNSNIDKFNQSISGMTAKIENGRYIFELDDNFTSYVKTDRDSNLFKKKFYFYNESASNNELFMKYVDRYLYSSSDETTKVKYEFIDNYIKSYAPADIITLVSSGTIPEISYDANNKCLEVSSNLYIQLSKKIVGVGLVPDGTLRTQINRACVGILENKAFPISTIYPFVNSYLTSSSVGTDFNHSTVMFDGHDYVMVRVYSYAGDTKGYMDIIYMEDVDLAKALENYQIHGDIELDKAFVDTEITPFVNMYADRAGTQFSESKTIANGSYDILLTVSSTTGGKLSVDITKVDKVSIESSNNQSSENDSESTFGEASSDEQQNSVESSSSSDTDDSATSPSSDDSNISSSSENGNQQSDNDLNTGNSLSGEVPVINDGDNIQ